MAWSSRVFGTRPPPPEGASAADVRGSRSEAIAPGEGGSRSEAIAPGEGGSRSEAIAPRGESAQIDQAEPRGAGDRLHPRAHAELAVQLRHVGLHGPRRDP